MTTPTVSVVMSVFNGERFVAEAIESILKQTFRDFEFIIIDDGSTDGTADILVRFAKADPRLVVHHHSNQGQVPSLNIGCGLARGRYIARIDADDIALPERFERQVDYLEQNPQVALVGSSITNIDEMGSHLSTWPLPTGNEEIQKRLFELRDIPFCHVTLMFRTEVFRAVKGYRTAFAPAEDYDLWLRMAERWQLANLPEPLVKVRRRSQSLSFTSARQQVISRLVAWSASTIRRAGGSDPICQEEPVSRDLVRTLGVSDEVFEESLMGVYQYWIDVMLQASDKAGALRIMHEALMSQSWEHINKSAVANMWLAAARIYFEQGRHLQGINCAARAFWARPIIAGRPVKRIVSRWQLIS
ncbi:MAG TPA: glycosyltransferase [Terriglobia bacterium]|nr:glycosyltransferase [Terriglobia bacterium]